MRDSDGFEIDRAFDLIPHVIGASWAVVWFRTNRVRYPTRDEYRNKVIEYMKILDALVDSFPKDANFEKMSNFVKRRHNEEIERILSGKNQEVEKRYDRYVDYG